MKKIAILLSLLFCSLFASAQNDVKVRFGVEAGYNLSKWDGDYKDLLGTSFKHGFNLGGLAEIQINQRWSVQPEFLLSMEGTKTDGRTFAFGTQGNQDNVVYFTAPDKVDAWFLKVPVYATYSFNVGPGRLSPGLGLYLAWAIAGKTNDIRTFATDSYFRLGYDLVQDSYLNYPQNFSDEEKQNMDLLYNCIPRYFDYGVGFKCMYELEKKAPGVFASVGVTEGLTGCFNLNVQVSFGYKWQYCKWLRSTYNTGILEYNP